MPGQPYGGGDHDPYREFLQPLAHHADRTADAHQDHDRGKDGRPQRQIGCAEHRLGDGIGGKAHDNKFEDGPADELNAHSTRWAGTNRVCPARGAAAPWSAGRFGCPECRSGRAADIPRTLPMTVARIALPRPRPGTRKLPASRTSKPIPRSAHRTK